MAPRADTVGLTPLMKMYTLGHAFMPPGIHAGGLRYHGEPQTILFKLSGHGHFDMAACDSYFAGRLEDFAYPKAAINAAPEHLPKVG